MGEAEDTQPRSRQDVLDLLDSFIDQIQQIRKIMLGMSVSAIVLAPLGIALSIYLMFHPSFFAVLEIENEFGLVLSILLGAVVIISGIWLSTGIRNTAPCPYGRITIGNTSRKRKKWTER